MTAYLNRKGIAVNRKRIQRLMRLMGLESVAPKPNTSRQRKGAEYFKFYNFERPHQSLVGKTPAEIYWGSEVAKKAA